AGRLLVGALLAGAGSAICADTGPHNDENKNPAAANARDDIDTPEPHLLAARFSAALSYPAGDFTLQGGYDVVTKTAYRGMLFL
ncbi:MAG: hypothetical protein WBE90_20345, partial [Xanthobacteraceae bacterium]